MLNGRNKLNVEDMTEADIAALDGDIEHLTDTLIDPKKDWGCEACKQDHIRLLRWLIMLRREIK